MYVSKIQESRQGRVLYIVNIIVYSVTSQIQLVWIITIEVTCVVLNMKKKCHGEESYQGDKSCSPFRNFLAVNTTAAKREDIF